MPSPRLTSLRLPSDHESVHEAVRVAEREGAAAGLSPDDLERIGIVVSEMVANAIEHGNAEHPEARVALQISQSDRGLTICVQDAGGGIAMDAIRRARLPEDLYATGGRGLFLIRELSDGVESTPRGLCVQIVARASTE